jgi:hypothetical protein
MINGGAKSIFASNGIRLSYHRAAAGADDDRDPRGCTLIDGAVDMQTRSTLFCSKASTTRGERSSVDGDGRFRQQ